MLFYYTALFLLPRGLFSLPYCSVTITTTQIYKFIKKPANAYWYTTQTKETNNPLVTSTATITSMATSW
jgi:hypothetical protein